MLIFFCVTEYLQDLSEVLLFLLLPPEDFQNKSFRYILRVGVDGYQSFLPLILEIFMLRGYLMFGKSFSLSSYLSL